ncbi:cytochrome c oxidase subunit 3 [Parasphingorhabdus flavimaris]|jgi:cytochrome c oxidase subunit III|uniref:cytochrome-c oxidase n=1 Tax=Parasphingorhabdus flavimaris TaxID=266812 RepID=A0ABX2N450_9SPHN|nr:cytochrome c oxidase subunit 3 [Parasphingorhabdus flavimaris]NVD28452.1 cytochrome c oxidase subunit 3 [Parasphingorhabdus flavimaris]|tara:strand:+ start:5987 stop:6847 length:861 start_codon:yes stop_codon:yes gene_type:complete
MAGAKNHDYHILPPDIWPLVGSFSAFVMAIGGIRWMHDMSFGPLVFAIGFAAIALTFYAWWANVIKEAHAGDHTPVVQLHLRYGMILFIASEVMFFVGWFWAWFDYALFPQPLEMVDGIVTNYIGQDGAAALLQWPPKGIEVLNAFELPLLNTMILLCSGTTVTWAHHSLIHGDRKGLITGLWLTIILGVLFSFIQAYEYSVAPFPFAGINYSSAFYMATGFHGFHVLVGTIFLIVCLARAYKGHFTPKQHFGFEAAAWYWHFVDVVWLFLFIVVYVWGGWGAPVH